MDDEPIIEAASITSRFRGDLNYKLLVMKHIDRCSALVLRLPHEVMTPTGPSGTEWVDIMRAFRDGVVFLEQLLSPYWDKEYLSFKEKTNAATRFSNTQEEQYSLVFKKYGELIRLCGRLDMLLEETDGGEL